MTQTLLKNAQALLLENDTGAFVKPATHQYPHQWNWDAAFVALGLSYFDPARAKQEVFSLLAGQWANGMIPHILYHHGASDYFPTPDFWQTDAACQDVGFATSGLTQPPILATCIRKMLPQFADRAQRLEFLSAVYPKLLAWHRWFYSARDPDGTGLVAIIHPWESGNDNSPRFSGALQALRPERVPAYSRKDRAHVDPEERPFEEDYVRYMYLIGVYRDLAWNDEAIYAQAPFLVQDEQFNVILHRANQDLRALALEAGQPADTSEIDTWLAKGQQAISQLWNEEAGLYFSRDVRTGEPLKVASAHALTPLFAGLPDAEQAERLVEHLRNPESFAPGEGSRFFTPTLAKNSPHHDPRRYWAGPVWINMNWLLWLGLKAYGYAELAATLREHSLELVGTSGFVEYYDPRDGSACGGRGFSWSAALAIHMLNEDAQAGP